MAFPPHDETERLRQRIAAGLSPHAFRTMLERVSWDERDAWLDRLLEIGELPADGPDLPRGCVPYLPSSVDTILSMVDLARVQADDVFVDLGSGLGRVLALTHLLTGAAAIGLEIQAALVAASRTLAIRLNGARISIIEGDAAQLTSQVMFGSVFYLYCPFSGARLDRVLAGVEAVARRHPIRICSVDLPLPSRPWLTPVAQAGGLSVYQSTDLPGSSCPSHLRTAR